MQHVIFCATLLASACSCAEPCSEYMAAIPGGNYIPLITQDAKSRRVSAFHLDKESTTNGEFLLFVRANPQWQRSNVKAVFGDAGYLQHWASDLDPGVKAPLAAPVVNVSWFAARAFLKSKGKRLPTMDEWEFAARASVSKSDASNDPAFTEKILRWYSSGTPDVLPPARDAEADLHGVRGLHGLIWEWVEDFNTVMLAGGGPERDAKNRSSFCGAGALNGSNSKNYAAFMRLAFRSSLRGSYCLGNLGFRGAQSLTKP